MNWKPLFLGLAAAAGGSALLCGLRVREIMSQSWGWFPAAEANTLTWVCGASLIICLLALIMATRPEKGLDAVPACPQKPEDTSEDHHILSDLAYVSYMSWKEYIEGQQELNYRCRRRW
jgi:hypothetical protein